MNMEYFFFLVVQVQPIFVYICGENCGMFSLRARCTCGGLGSARICVYLVTRIRILPYQPFTQPLSRMKQRRTSKYEREYLEKFLNTIINLLLPEGIANTMFSGKAQITIHSDFSRIFLFCLLSGNRNTVCWIQDGASTVKSKNAHCPAPQSLRITNHLSVLLTTNSSHQTLSLN